MGGKSLVGCWGGAPKNADAVPFFSFLMEEGGG